jgi:hypothetical protein
MNQKSFAMTALQLRIAPTAVRTVDQFLVRAMPFLALAIGLIAFSPAVLACGGGGSGSYRKPPRPDQHHDTTSLNPQAEKPSGEITPPAKN